VVRPEGIEPPPRFVVRQTLSNPSVIADLPRGFHVRLVGVALVWWPVVDRVAGHVSSGTSAQSKQRKLFDGYAPLQIGRSTDFSSFRHPGERPPFAA